MPAARPSCLILAEPPSAFIPLGGISMLERLLRVLQRLDFREAMILSGSIEEVRTHLAKPSWARAELELRFHKTTTRGLSVAECLDLVPERALIVAADFYCDARLLRAVAERGVTTLLIDSNLPDRVMPAALVDRSWLSQQRGATALTDALVHDAARRTNRNGRRRERAQLRGQSSKKYPAGFSACSFRRIPGNRGKINSRRGAKWDARLSGAGARAG